MAVAAWLQFTLAALVDASAVLWTSYGFHVSDFQPSKILIDLQSSINHSECLDDGEYEKVRNRNKPPEQWILLMRRAKELSENG